MRTLENLNKKYRNWKLAACWVAFMITFIFAPRHDGPHMINGVRFTTKTGADPLTYPGMLLLVVIPVSLYIVLTLVIKWVDKKNS